MRVQIDAIMLALCSLILGFGYFLILVRSPRQPLKIAGITVVYVFLILFFGCLYHFLFLRDPFSFCFASQLEEAAIHSTFDSKMQRLKDLDERMCLLALVRQEGPLDADKLGQMKQESGLEVTLTKVDDDLFGRLYYMRIYDTVLGIWKEYPDPADGYFLMPDLFSIDEVVHAKSNLSFMLAIDKLIKRYCDEREYVLRDLRSLIRARPEWSRSDFIYFSAVTATTLGYGDILPNSSTARRIIIVQVILSILVISFGLVIVGQRGLSGPRSSGTQTSD